jgi:hypothetical protein
MRSLLAVLGLAGLALGAAPPPRSAPLDLFLLRFDRNADGVIDRREWPGPPAAFARMDADKDRKLIRAELKPFEDRLGRFLGKRRPAGRPGEVITPAAKGERKAGGLSVGQAAPDFTLPDLEGKKTVTLSAFKGKRPVVLIFASYT